MTELLQLPVQPRRFLLNKQVRVVAGLDSLTEGTGSPVTSYINTLEPALKAILGDAGIGLQPISYGARMTRVFGTGAFTRSAGGDYINNLAWSSPIRQRSIMGQGFYYTAAGGAETLGVVPTVGLGAVVAVRVILELRSTGASLRMRQTSSQLTSLAHVINEANGYAVGSLISVTRPLDGAISPGFYFDQITGDVSIYAVDFVTSTPGVTVTNLGLGGVQAAEWALMLDSRAREWSRLFQADATLLNAGTNDRNVSDAMQFSRNIDILIDRFQAAGPANVMLICPNDTSDFGFSNLKDIASILQGVAQSRRCGFHNNRDALGSYATAVANGDMLDTVHPNSQGSAKITAALLPKLLPLA